MKSFALPGNICKVFGSVLSVELSITFSFLGLLVWSVSISQPILKTGTKDRPATKAKLVCS